MNSPYLVKQFVSSDTQDGVFSKFYWLYEPKDNKENIGIGMFFEVVSGDLDESSYSYISKSMWDIFVRTYEKTGFDKALQRASFKFIQILKDFKVDQIDVNFVFWVIKSKEQGYVLNLAIVGEADVVLLRDANLVNLHEYAPVNHSLNELKYVELDLLPGDELFVANRFLVENLINTPVFKYGSLSELLNSLKEFEKELTGNKKLFFLGIEVKDKVLKNVLEEDVSSMRTQRRTTLADVLANVKQKVEPVLHFVADNTKKLIPKKSSRGEGKLVEPSVEGDAMQAGLNLGLNKFNYKRYLEGDAGGKEQEVEFSAGPQLEVEEEESTKEERETTESHVKESQQELSPEEYIEEIRMRRSKFGRLMFAIKRKLQRLYGERRFVVQDSISYFNKKRRVRLGIYLAGGFLLVLIVFNLFNSYHAKKQERQATQVFIQSEVTGFLKFYEEEVKPIQAEDPDHLLDLCLKQGQEVQEKLKNKIDTLQYKENKEKLDLFVDKVSGIVQDCQKRYDKVHNIVRVKDVVMVKDFTADLGAESNVVGVTYFKGVLYVVDRGKKAVYKVNPENGRIVKLEDSEGVIQDPVDIAVNEDKILLCDKISGIVAYKSESFTQLVGTSKESLGQSCILVRGFYTNAYFVLQSADKLYKSIGYDAGYSLPTVYINNIANIKDVIIDGNIYILRKKKNRVTLERYFQGKFDASFRMKESLDGVVSGYSNPSSNFPVYLYNEKQNTILVVEKPTPKRHPGYGVVIKTYKLPDKYRVQDFIVDLSVVNNKETWVYFISNNVLWKFRLQ